MAESLGQEQLPALIAELKKLRIGTGLTVSKLQVSPQLRVVLGDAPLNEGYVRLISLVRQLGDGIPARALRAAYAIDYSDQSTVTERRKSFGASIERYDPGTLIGYEDQAISQLAATLLNEPPNLPATYEFLCVANYVNGQLLSIVSGPVNKEYFDDEPAGESVSVGFDGAPYLSLGQWQPKTEYPDAAPCVIYQVPFDARPDEVTIGCNFFGSRLPEDMYSASAPTLFGVLAKDNVIEVRQAGSAYLATWTDVKPGEFFAAFWRWSEEDVSRRVKPK